MKKILLTLAAIIAICAATMTGAFAEESLIYSEDFSDEVQRWWGSSDGLTTYTSPSGDTYTNGNYVKHITGGIRLNTCYSKNVQPTVTKASYSNGALGYSVSYLPSSILLDSYKLTTDVTVQKAIAGNVTEGVWAFSQTVLSNYKMQYAICYDGIYVLGSDESWTKAEALTHDALLTDFSTGDDGKQYTSSPTDYSLTVSVKGETATLTAVRGGDTYTCSWRMPAVSGYNVITDIQMSSKSSATSSGYNTVDVKNIKLYNVSDNIMYDDATTTSFKNASYGSNVKNYTSTSSEFGKYTSLTLSDATDASGANNMITYTLPENTVLKSFNILASGQAVLNSGTARGEIKFYGVKKGVKTEINATKTTKYINGWPLKYELTDDVSAYEYDSLAIELLSANNYPAKLISAVIEYEKVPEFYTVKASKEEVLINDECTTQKWFVVNSNTAEHTTYSSDGTKLDSLNITAEMKLTKNDGNNNSKYLLTGVIRDNYNDYNKYTISKVVEGVPADDQYGVKKTIVNGKYEMTYAVAYDGIYVKDSAGEWVRAIEITNDPDFYTKDYYTDANGVFHDLVGETVTYEISVEVRGKNATMTAKYQTVEGGDYTAKTYSFTMPKTESFNNVTIASKVSDSSKGRNRVWVQTTKLTNLWDNLALVDDAQKKYDFVTYGSNIEVNTIAADSSYNYSQVNQIDVIDPAKNTDATNRVTYTAPDGYLRDFLVTRRLNSTNQGSLYLMLIDSDGLSTYLAKDTDYTVKVVYLHSGHAYYYRPTDSLKDKLAGGKYEKLVCRLNIDSADGGTHTERSSAILRTVISYDVPEDYTLGYTEFDTTDGNAVLYGEITKNVSSAPNFKLIIASYDADGRLVDAKISDEYKPTKGVATLITSETIKSGVTHKVFLWATDKNGNLTQTPILEEITE